MAYNYVTKVKSEGLSQCLKDISKYNARCRIAVENALAKGVKEVRKGAKRRVAVDSGNLKKSITSSFKKKTLVGVVKATKPHAHLIEFGVKPSLEKPINKKVLRVPVADGYKFMPNATIPARRARPFMIPAFHENENKIVADVKKGLQNA